MSILRKRVRSVMYANENYLEDYFWLCDKEDMEFTYEDELQLLLKDFYQQPFDRKVRAKKRIDEIYDLFAKQKKVFTHLNIDML